jgi:tetratricopeptide (TPR) repeat protein
LKLQPHSVFFALTIACLMVVGGCKAKKNSAITDAEGNAEAASQFDNYFIDACTHANTGNYDVALKLFNKCKDIKPQEASVYYEMSRLYDKMGDKAMSLQNAMKAWQYASSNTYYGLWYANRLRQNNQVDDAIVVLEKLFAENKKDEQIVKDLDYLYDRKGDIPKRITLWNAYQSATQYKLSTSVKLIDLYKSQKDYKSAHQVYEQIKKASPAKYQYYIDDANLYLEHGDEINANINFEKAIEINPNNWKINYALYRSYRKKNDINKAGLYLGKAFADVNTSFDMKLSTCMELNNEAKTDTSAYYFMKIAATEIVKLYPENANAQLTAARFFEQTGNISAALKSYQNAYTSNPNMFDAWLGAISCSDRLSLYTNLSSISEQAIEYYPNVAALYASAAKGYNKTRQYEKALEHVTSGKSFALDNEAKYQLFMQEGFAYFKLKNYVLAEKAYEAALAINATEKELYDELGNVKYFLNKADEAVSNWQKAKDMGIKNGIIDKKIRERKFYE